MTDLIYGKDTLAEIYNLRKGDIDILIEAEGIPCFSVSKKKFVGYIPSLGASFKLDTPELKRICASNVSKKTYKVSLEDSLISIASKTPAIPASSFLFKNLWFKPASKLLEIDENFSLLLPARHEVPIYCGHKRIIARLSENFAGDIYVVNTHDFINQWSNDEL